MTSKLICIAATLAGLALALPAAGQASAATDRVTGIVLISHGRMAREAAATAELVVGKQSQLMALSVDPKDDIEERRDALLEAVKKVDRGCGVIVMADFFGGAPSNLAISVLKPGQVEVIAGLNMPMLIKAISMSGNCRLMDTVENAAAAGRKYISVATELLKKAPAEEDEAGDASAQRPKP